MNRQTVQNVRNVQRRVARLETKGRYNTLADAIAAHLTIPGLIGFWPMSVIRLDNVTDRVRDASGAGYHLAWNGGGGQGFLELVPVAYFNGTTAYQSRADGGAANWADITGAEANVLNTATVRAQGLALGGWFRFDDVVSNSALISKFDDSANQRSYMLFLRGATSQLEFHVSSDGTAGNTTTVVNVGAISASTWYNVIGVFSNNDNTITIQVNGTTTSAAHNATVFDSTADFFIGAADGGPNYYMEGYTSLCWLSQMYISDDLKSSLYQQTWPLFVGV